MNSKKDQLLEMLKEEPLDSFLNYALALELAKENNISAAISLMEEVLQRDEKYLGAYYQLGKLYEQKQDLEKAIRIYQKGVAIATAQNNKKTLGELNEALWMLEED